MADFEYSCILLKGIGEMLRQKGAVVKTDIVNGFGGTEHRECIIYSECDEESWKKDFERMNSKKIAKDRTPFTEEEKDTLSKYPVLLKDDEMSWFSKWTGTDYPAYYASRVIDRLIVTEEFFENDYDGYYAFLNGRQVEIRGLVKKDTDAVKALDEESGFSLCQWVSELDENAVSEYAYGVFVYDDNENRNGKLIGYCTLGYADDCGDDIENHPMHNCDSLLLSDVFVLPGYRHKGIGTFLVSKAVSLKWQYGIEAVFCCPMSESLEKFYEGIGFKKISDASMIKVG